MAHSPFPGMDPFLEKPSKWSSVHTRLINAISDQLAKALSPNFYVEIEERVTLTLAGDSGALQQIEPDVYLVRGQPKAQHPVIKEQQITAPTLVEAAYQDEVRQRYLEIRDATNREVVTTIELLSPFNKSPGLRGHVDFMDKRKQVMASNVHWIEIDLLRAGTCPAEVAAKSDYYALLKRGGVLEMYEVWYIDLRDLLPTIAVPLRSPFEDVPLNLQDAFDDIYRRAYYADSLDYTEMVPLPHCAPADAAWIRQQIQAWMAERTA